MLYALQFPGGPPRSLEDLKDRYYSIARKLMVAREGTDATLLNQPLLRNPYNANQGMRWGQAVYRDVLPSARVL